MGIYNTYGNVQIKIGDLGCKIFKVGDKVDIADGIYVGYGGVIVIKDNIFAMEVDTLTDKWGQPIKCDKVLRGRGLSELLDKTEVIKEETPKPEVVKPVETAPKVKEKEIIAPEIVPKVDKKETPIVEVAPKVEEKKEPVIEKEKTIPEAPKEEKKD